MYINMSIIACSFVYLSLFVVIFFNKKKVKSYETRLYGELLIFNLLGLFLEFCCFITVKFIDIMPMINTLVNRSYLICFVTIITTFTLYFYYATVENVKLQFPIKLVVNIVYVVSILFVCLLPLEYFYDGEYLYSYGLATQYIYLLGALYVLFDFYCIFTNGKVLERRKYIPLVILLICFMIVFPIRILNPGITLITCSFAFVTAIMYFTIENPDMKILKEYHKSKEIAENANNEKAVFLLNISQDIKKPATNINKLAYELKEEAKNLKEDEIIKYGQAIKSQSQEILQSINNVLDISTFETHDLKIVDTKYLPETLFKQLVKSLKINNNVELQVNIDNTLPEMLYGDSIRIKEALKIILDNSIKYTKKGFISISVKSVIKNEICRLIITIEDSGTGIASTDLENIFDKGSLGKAKKIVTLIGGSITVNSQINKGSKFIVVLDQLMSKDNKLLNRLDDRYMNNKRVLIVDYDIKTIKTIKKYLKHYNCVIEESLESIDCLNKIRNNKHYDLIFIREDMPKLTGDDIIFKLNQINEFKIPIVMLIKTNKNTKYDEYVVTPVNKSLLYEVVDDYLK